MTLVYDNIYLLNAIFRREVSSDFGAANQGGNFVAVNAGINLRRWLKMSENDLIKLHVGYGTTGNIQLYPSTFYVFNGVAVSANDKHEHMSELNAGIDFSVFQNRLTGSVDYFSRDMTDLIYGFMRMSPNTYNPNNGALKATGLEASLTARIVEKQNFTWSTTINVSTVTQTWVAPIGTSEVGNIGAPGLNGIYTTLLKDGQPFGQLNAPVYLGANLDGSPRYQNLNNDGIVQPYGLDRKILGSALPNLSLGWHNTLRVGAFDFNMFWRGVFGHSLVSAYRIFYERAPNSNLNTVNTTLYDPKLQQSEYSSRVVEKADYIKLDNVALGYNFNFKSSKLRQARIFIAANNPLVFTSYMGIDPEARYTDASDPVNGSSSTIESTPLPIGIERRYCTVLFFQVIDNVSFTNINLINVLK